MSRDQQRYALADFEPVAFSTAICRFLGGPAKSFRVVSLYLEWVTSVGSDLAGCNAGVELLTVDGDIAWASYVAFPDTMTTFAQQRYQIVFSVDRTPGMLDRGANYIPQQFGYIPPDLWVDPGETLLWRVNTPHALGVAEKIEDQVLTIHAPWD